MEKARNFIDKLRGRKKPAMSMYQSIGPREGAPFSKVISQVVMWGNAALAVACLCGFVGYISEAYIPTDMSNWKNVWATLFSFIAAVFAGYVAFVEYKTPIREHLGLKFATNVVYCVVLGAVDIVIFLCFVAFILDSEGSSAAWSFMGFVSILGLFVLEVDKAHSAYMVSSGDEGKGHYLLINAEALDDCDYDVDGASLNTANKKSSSTLSVCGICTGFVVIVIALLVLMVFMVFSMQNSFEYVKMVDNPGKSYKVSGGARLNFYCSGDVSNNNNKSTFPYTVILEHDTDVPSPSMVQLLHTLSHSYGVRACVYDRSGYGWSSRTKNKLSSATMAKQLNDLLVAAKEEPPFVIGAHGRAGFVAAEYLAAHNSSVAGLILLDSYLIGKREKEINKKSYKSSMKSVIEDADAVRAFAPFGVAHYNSLSRMKTIKKYLDDNITIKPKVTLSEAFMWTM